MEITHLGHASFKIRGKNVTLVTDPYDPEFIGLKFPKVEADIVTVSHQHGDHNFSKAVLGNPVVVAGPGEYEIKGVKIIGVSTFHDDVSGTLRGRNTVYRIQLDKIALGHCGDLGHKLNDKQLELLDDIDILMIPVGGEVTVSGREAAAIISDLEPKIVIPMHYRVPGLISSIAGKLADVAVFLKEVGKESIKPVPKLTISKDSLPLETTVVVLE